MEKYNIRKAGIVLILAALLPEPWSVSHQVPFPLEVEAVLECDNTTLDQFSSWIWNMPFADVAISKFKPKCVVDPLSRLGDSIDLGRIKSLLTGPYNLIHTHLLVNRSFHTCCVDCW